MVSQFALHHLPDFWKGQALARIAALLRPGGLFYLRDVVFGFAPAAATEEVEAWIGAVAEPEGEGFTRADFAGHVRDEHSTYDFLLEALLQRCGFEIEERRQSLGAYAAYLCRRR